MVPAAAHPGQATTRLDWTILTVPRLAVCLRHLPVRTLLLAAIAGCSARQDGSATCGISALTAPLVVLESFGKGNLLDHVPPDIPTHLPVRFVAGPAVRGNFAIDSAGQIAATLAVRPAGTVAGYAVLVVDGLLRAQGAVVFEGTGVPGATLLGKLTLPDTTLPLLGVRLDPRSIADPRCPLLPDSLR